jgi:ssRNA-specific RNase YbeY (16S rRNA maturation enzyme)
MINIVCPSRYKINSRSIKQTITETLIEQKQPTRAVLNVVFVGTRKMRGIAKTYKHENVALPVLAFAYKELDLSGENFLGEIFLCYPQVVLLAAERSKRTDDMINLMVEHGLMNIIKDESTPVIMTSI